MKNKLLVALFYYLLSLFVCLIGHAHEYWLEADDFITSIDKKINIHLKIGQNFKANSFVYVPSEIKSINRHKNNKTFPLNPKLGDYPAISIAALDSGLHIVSVESELDTITYKKWSKFKTFVQKEGIEWVLEQHKKRQLPEKDFIETYFRHSKILIGVADAKGQDRQLGLEFEWVLLSNPYTTKEDSLKAQLWWRGKVYANAQARLLIKQEGKLTEQILITDNQGQISFKIVKKASYLLNAVHMIIPEQLKSKATGAVWESRWASLTFATGPRVF